MSWWYFVKQSIYLIKIVTQKLLYQILKNFTVCVFWFLISRKKSLLTICIKTLFVILNFQSRLNSGYSIQAVVFYIKVLYKNFKNSFPELRWSVVCYLHYRLTLRQSKEYLKVFLHHYVPIRPCSTVQNPDKTTRASTPHRECFADS